MSEPRRFFVHGPTPLWRHDNLDDIVGAEVWVKRDDMTSGAAAGNKIRKLELLLGHALSLGAQTVVTCGGFQSNHARATALSCAELGMRCILLLRVPDPAAAYERPLELTGNVLLDALSGAEIRFVSPEQYQERVALLEQVRVEEAGNGRLAYLVPEGGSNGRGALGYVEAMREVRGQLDLGLAGGAPFDLVAHACGSGGTAAGVALGAPAFGVAKATWAFAVCDDRAYFERVIGAIAQEARGFDPSLPELSGLVVDDQAKGPAYGVMSDEQKEFLLTVSRATGLVVDPVYTGKALFGLAEAVKRGDIRSGARILFLHTGGLPGLLAQGEELRGAIGA